MRLFEVTSKISKEINTKYQYSIAQDLTHNFLYTSAVFIHFYGRFMLHTLSQLRSGELAGISQLKLSENLSTFPLEILTLADSLEILDLSHNALSSLPDELAQMTKLKIIFASQNKFEHLPEVLGQLPNLEMVGFKSNQIKQVAEHSLPAQLRWLILTDNLIETLPNSLGERPRLQKLALAGNQLTHLPQTLAQADNLELVRISANKLTKCPEQLLNLPNLAWFAFAGNPFTTVNSEADAEVKSVPELSSSSYTLENVLGQGASGVISKAHWNTPQPQFPEDIAVKVFKGEITSDGYPQDELQACLQVGYHPNLVESVAQVNEENYLALVMTLIPENYRNLVYHLALKAVPEIPFHRVLAYLSLLLVISLTRCKMYSRTCITIRSVTVIYRSHTLLIAKVISFSALWCCD